MLESLDFLATLLKNRNVPLHGSHVSPAYCMAAAAYNILCPEAAADCELFDDSIAVVIDLQASPAPSTFTLVELSEGICGLVGLVSLVLNAAEQMEE